jgi:hypothetical protein
MSSRVKLLFAVFVLIAVGAGLSFYKVRTIGMPFWKADRLYEWLVEAKVSFFATGGKVKARLSLPANAINKSARLDSGSLGYSYFTEPAGSEYTAVWTADSREKLQSLYYGVLLPPNASSGAEPLPSEVAPPVAEIPGLPAEVADAAGRVVAQSKGLSSDPEALFVDFFRQLQSETASQEVVLVRRHYEKEFKERTVIAMGIDLLGMAGVPARIAYGVKLKTKEGSQAPIPLVEYYDGAYWKVRDPQQPEMVLENLPIFVWHRGGGPLLDVTGGENSRVTFTVSREQIPLNKLTDLSDRSIFVSTILSLPADQRDVFRYIVLIPLGAFVVVLLRNIVGISTLGTFMPVLLALALLEIPLETGLIMFTVIIASGLWFRFLLSRLNLLVVPRVAACVVIVTLLMMLMSVLSHKMGFGSSVEITLFPMIILAWTIERMSLIWEEEGKRSALTQVAGSVFVAVLAFFFMSIGQVQYWAFYFPELLLVLLAGILLIGRYTGYRLSELIRFKSFSEA